MRMKKSQNRICALLAVLAFVAVLGISVKDSLAYFTTYARAKGGVELTLGNKTEIDEEYENGQKHIKVKNTGNADCYVRVKVFAGSQIELSYSGSENWILNDVDADGYYYYKNIVPAGKATEELIASISAENIKNLKTDYDVIVIQECAPVMYDENGAAYPVTAAEVWAQSFEIKQEGGAGNE